MDLTKLTAYEIIEHRPLPDLKSEGALLRHKKSGARAVSYTHLDVYKRQDKEHRELVSRNTSICFDESRMEEWTFENADMSDAVTVSYTHLMARGEMVRFISEDNIENPVEIQKFDRIGYSFRTDLSSDSKYVFERKIK